MRIFLHYLFAFTLLPMGYSASAMDNPPGKSKLVTEETEESVAASHAPSLAPHSLKIQLYERSLIKVNRHNMGNLVKLPIGKQNMKNLRQKLMVFSPQWALL